MIIVFPSSIRRCRKLGRPRVKPLSLNEVDRLFSVLGDIGGQVSSRIGSTPQYCGYRPHLLLLQASLKIREAFNAAQSLRAAVAAY